MADQRNDSEERPRSEQKQAEFIANPPELDGVCDLSQLIYMEMPNVLYNLEHRYLKMSSKFCYTSISSILLAINPYEYLPIYGEDVIEHFKRAADKGSLPTDRPHPYGVSARSYMRLVRRKKNQSVIVCGESGAGKTETTKKLLKYLAVTAPSSFIDSKTIEDQIVAASPILESFGNAKTVMNNNSSRFGKFTKLLYSVPENERSGSILGSYLETYLLEKSRVVFQANNERNYHIFYFLHNAFKDNKQKMSELYLDKVETFNYINQGKVSETFKDVENFEELIDSLEKFRINSLEQHVLFQVTSGIMNLGNITFKKEDSGYAQVDISKCQKYIDAVAKLWDIDSNALIKRLTTSSVIINKKTIVKQINFDDAHSNRDSIAKGLYESIFLWLCQRINEELFLDEAKGDEKTRTDLKFIGILDVFGFENFWDNSLEQFCINYTNEKLQQFFNYHIIMSEQEEYLAESVLWTPLQIPDNAEYLDLVETKGSGFFALLDSQCRGPSKDDTTAFLQQLFKKHAKNKTICRVTKAGSGNWRGTKVKKSKKSSKKREDKYVGFEIKHFADDVSYNGAEFLKKNAESVHSDTFKMFKKSSRPILQQIKQTKSKKKKTVTSVFHKGIRTLMKSLKKTEPYFVRCINPNKQKSKDIWTESIVEHQLRCGGLLEALKVLKLGYPTRVPYKTLYEKYHCNVDNPLIKNMNESAFSTSLLIAFDVDEKDYELGLTKIFFKPAKAAVLDTIMSKAGEPLTQEQNDKITRFIVGKRINQLSGTIRAFIKWRTQVRMARARHMWTYSGRVVSVLGATVCKQLKVGRKQIQLRKEAHGRLCMQTMYRGYVERTAYKQQIAQIKEAVAMIWTSYRCMQQKHCLEHWLMERAALRARELAQKAQEEEERIKQEAEALKLAKEAEAAKQKVVITVTNMDDQKEKEKEQKIALQKQIEAKRQKQTMASFALKRIKTKNLLEIADANKLKKDQAIEQAINRRTTADLTLQNTISERIKNQPLPDNDGDSDSSSSSSLGGDDDYKDENSDDDEFDITELLENFTQIARLGARFSRHAGKRINKKPQLRTVKVSFDEHGTPLTLSWGAGSRAIKMKDIWYISWGHYTPTFIARREVLEPLKCFSIVGHSEKQVLDLEAYTKREAKIWVKGLRRLISQSDENADKLAAMNQTRLQQYAQKADEAKKQLKTKQLRVVKLQQDLFVMTVEAVYKQLEEEKIWIIDGKVREQFNAKSMYESVLKRDIAWRNWQWFVRESITNYLRENKLVTQTEDTADDGMTDNGDNNHNDKNNHHGDEDEVMRFLKFYKLQKYDGRLREDAGLECLHDLKGLSASEIMNICKEVSMATLHGNKFVAAVKDLQNGLYPPKKTKKKKDLSNREIDEFLKKYKLAKYSAALKANGFVKLKDISSLNMMELDCLANECKMATLHKKKFISACDAYKKYVKSKGAESAEPNNTKEKTRRGSSNSIFNSFRGKRKSNDVDDDGCKVM